MRFLIRVRIPVEEGNRMTKDPKFLQKIEEYSKKVRAEASYFFEDRGQRTMAFIVNMPSADAMPLIAEPMFQAYNADVEFHPVMVLGDLKKGLAKK